MVEVVLICYSLVTGEPLITGPISRATALSIFHFEKNRGVGEHTGYTVPHIEDYDPAIHKVDKK